MQKLINPDLLRKLPCSKIIPNDVAFDNHTSIFIITGPNSGGKKDKSRLVDECIQMRKILDKMTDRSLLLMDESFSGTSAEEGAIIAVEVLRTIQAMRTKCIFSTHLHELAGNVSYFNQKKPYIQPLSAEYRNGERTYRIVPSEPGGKSYAYEIAKKYGLAYTGEE